MESVLMSIFAFNVLLVAIVLYLKYIVNPNRLLKLPGPMGFIFWVMRTGRQPAPYFEINIWNHLELKKGDVVVSAGAKMGTNWIINMVHQLRTGGEDESIPDIQQVAPWPELLQYPGQTEGERLKHFQQHCYPAFPAFRLFKTRYGPDQIALHPDVKYIAAVRNSVEVADSFGKLFATHTDEFKKMWGGFPPKLSGDMWQVMHFLRAHPHFIWGHFLRWWPARHRPNVLFVHYSDSRRDLHHVMTSIADFLGLEVRAEQWPAILEKSSMEWMRQHSDSFRYELFAGPMKGRYMMAPPSEPGRPSSRADRSPTASGDASEARPSSRGGGWEEAPGMDRHQEESWMEYHAMMIPDAKMRDFLDKGGPLPKDSDRSPPSSPRRERPRAAPHHPGPDPTMKMPPVILLEKSSNEDNSFAWPDYWNHPPSFEIEKCLKEE